ncbi:MAG: HNH endonuclease [Dehalococcoidales bacterium]|nr:HNH endonuclease [Dehalococcoidales bacterium]
MKLCIYCGKELPSKRRKYCSDECSQKYFQEFILPLWWKNAREAALRRAEYKCEQCGAKDKLEVHHKIKLPDPNHRHNHPLNRQDNLVVLCRTCHENTHRGEKKIPVQQLRMVLG